MAKALSAAVLVALVCTSFLGAGSAQQPQRQEVFYEAIRADDTAALRALVAAHGANAPDAGGLTPLMLAVAFGSASSVDVLLDAGADVKAATGAGLTALHLASRDERFVRLLLARGADVHARTQLGSTPLLVAASGTGTAAAVARLLDKGADPNAAENRGVTPLIAAASAGNTAAGRLLLERGANPRAYAPGMGQKTATPLMGAAHSGDTELARLILARKPDLDVQSSDRDANVKNGPVAFGLLTALHLATAAASRDTVALLLDAGASVDPRDVRGLTPLAWAVATDRPDPGIVRLLLQRGADASIRSKDGEDARDWAHKFNNPAVLAELKLSAISAAAQPTAAASAAPVTPRAAVERSMPLLRTGSSRVMSDGGCVACHAQPMAAMAADLALARGWRAEPPATDASQVALSMTTGVTGFLQGREAGGLPDSHLFNTLMMAARRSPSSLATDAFVAYLAAKQRPAGHWHGITTRPPMQDGDINRTALAVRTLTFYATPARRTELERRVARAAAWLAAQDPLSTEERVMQLLGLRWADAHAAVRETRTRELIAAQRRDGGWGQTTHLATDGYATGQVLYTLRELGVPASEPAVQRAIAFLLRTQRDDGSWYVRSRAMKIQPYFESGFPHGHDQWISQAATAWAAMGLTLGDTP
jgi:ankyrin repeat protein